MSSLPSPAEYRILYAELFAAYGMDYFRREEFTNAFMNDFQASKFSDDEAVRNYISTNLREIGEASTMRGVFALYDYWHKRDGGPDVPRILFEFFLGQESTEGENLDLQEIQAGLAFKSRVHLWEAFLEIANDPSNYPSLDDETSRRWLRQTRAMKASLLRRQDRLDEAQDLLAENLKLMEEDAARGDQLESGLGFSYYEAGYLSFMIGEWDEALSFFSRSSDLDSGKLDEVGGAISLCLEFRVRYLLGRVSAAEFSQLLFSMIEVFQRNTGEKVLKRGHARRWVWGCWAHQLEIAVDTEDGELGSRAIEELRSRTEEFPDPSFLDHYEGMFAFTQRNYKQAAAKLADCWNFRTDDGDPSRFRASESKSQIPYLLGRSHALTGDREKAEEWLKMAAEFAARPGNHTWRSRSLSALRLLRHSLIR